MNVQSVSRMMRRVQMKSTSATPALACMAGACPRKEVTLVPVIMATQVTCLSYFQTCRPFSQPGDVLCYMWLSLYNEPDRVLLSASLFCHNQINVMCIGKLIFYVILL